MKAGQAGGPGFPLSLDGARRPDSTTSIDQYRVIMPNLAGAPSWTLFQGGVLGLHSHAQRTETAVRTSPLVYAPSVINSILRLPSRRAPFSVTTMESPNSAGVEVCLTGTLGFRSNTMPA